MIGHLQLLVQTLLFVVGHVAVVTPALGLVRHSQAFEDRVVETVLADEQLMDSLQEHAALGALDDAVVVGAGDGDDL